jgi:predicted anti-sigma-YlaC factor YlaD
MADTTSNKPQSGFTLPPPTVAPEKPPEITSQPTGSALRIDVGSSGPSSRDILIGGAVLLVLMVAFFFAKNAYANLLVGKRVQPRSANAAGWWLWVFLTLLSVGVILAAVSGSVLMAPFIVGPLVLGAIVALVLMLVSAKR